MKKLIALELRRNNLRPYLTASLVIGACLLAMVFLLAAIPHMDPGEQDLDLFTTYGSLINLICILAMASFTILSAVMHGKITIDEYTGKRAVLLLSYPVSRRKILTAKITMVFLHTVISMAGVQAVVFAVFFVGTLLFPMGMGTLSLGVIMDCLFLVILYSIIAALLGCVSLWFGYWKQSSSAAIVAAVVIVVVACQSCGISVNYVLSACTLFITAGVFGAIAISDLGRKVDMLEV